MEAALAVAVPELLRGLATSLSVFSAKSHCAPTLHCAPCPSLTCDRSSAVEVSPSQPGLTAGLSVCTLAVTVVVSLVVGFVVGIRFAKLSAVQGYPVESEEDPAIVARRQAATFQRRRQ